jgi:hypothetical protein
VDVVATVGSDEQASAAVQPGEGALDDPAMAAEPGAVLALPAGDDRLDAALLDEAAVLVVVVTTVADQRSRPSSWAADTAAYGRYAVEQGEQLRDVVAVAAGERPGQRHAAAVYEQVMLAAQAASVDGARTGLGAPFFACR